MCQACNYNKTSSATGSQMYFMKQTRRTFLLSVFFFYSNALTYILLKSPIHTLILIYCRCSKANKNDIPGLLDLICIPPLFNKNVLTTEVKGKCFRYTSSLCTYGLYEWHLCLNWAQSVLFKNININITLKWKRCRSRKDNNWKSNIRLALVLVYMKIWHD